MVLVEPKVVNCEEEELHIFHPQSIEESIHNDRPIDPDALQLTYSIGVHLVKGTTAQAIPVAIATLAFIRTILDAKLPFISIAPFFGLI